MLEFVKLKKVVLQHTQYGVGVSQLIGYAVIIAFNYRNYFSFPKYLKFLFI